MKLVVTTLHLLGAIIAIITISAATDITIG